MAITIKGIYEDGHISLIEEAPTNKKVQVSITFPEEDANEQMALQKNEIRWGSLAGKISIPDDFNDELEDFKEYR